MTLNTYGREREGALQDLAQSVGKTIQNARKELQKNKILTKAAGMESIDISSTYNDKIMVEAGGIECQRARKQSSA